MKEVGKDTKCDQHGLPFLKIQTNSRRLLCDKCLNESEDERHQRIELLRLKLNKTYLIQLRDLKQAKQISDKYVQLFQARNMSEAKKIINKASNEVQKIVQILIDREVKQANKILKETAQNQLEKWKMIDGRNFSSAYLQFQEQYPKIQQRMNQLKQTLKHQIANKLKQEIRVFYSNLFEF